jgi:hypothetical protein
VEAHLDLLASVGGNYVRCTMSSRDKGNVWQYARDATTGLYDLERFGEEYWRRFATFLTLCAARDIVLQVEMWDRFDYARGPWQDNPFNPRNSINYTAGESGLKEEISTHPGQRENAFFRSVPALEHNALILRYQHALVDEILRHSLPYGNVLYCMDNETNESPEWPAYWARYIRARADDAGVTVQLTEMWDAHDLHDPQHTNTFGHPELYTFIDISQNNHRPASRHWDNAQDMRQRVIDSGHVRPMNSVKIYGANTGHFGNSRDAQERFWRNIFGGLATARFHRPDSGIGLSPRAQAHIKSMRMLTGELDIFTCEPHNELLGRRSWNEAYCTADPGRAYAVFFTDGGDLYLDVRACAGEVEVTWLDIVATEWLPPTVSAAEGRIRLTTPREEGYWAALVRKK